MTKNELQVIKEKDVEMRGNNRQDREKETRDIEEQRQNSP